MTCGLIGRSCSTGSETMSLLADAAHMCSCMLLFPFVRSLHWYTAASLFWVDRESVRPADGLLSLVANVTGPRTKAFIDKVEACAEANCSSHGRCMPVESNQCECFAGWSGAKCERRAR